MLIDCEMQYLYFYNLFKRKEMVTNYRIHIHIFNLNRDVLGHLICQLPQTSIKTTAFCHSLNTDPAIFRKCLNNAINYKPLPSDPVSSNEGGDFRANICTISAINLFLSCHSQPFKCSSHLNT